MPDNPLSNDEDSALSRYLRETERERRMRQIEASITRAYMQDLTQTITTNTSYYIPLTNFPEEDTTIRCDQCKKEVLVRIFPAQGIFMMDCKICKACWPKIVKKVEQENERVDNPYYLPVWEESAEFYSP